MKLYYFSEMPHHEYPDAEGDKYPSLRLAFPNTFFSPEIAHKNYRRYLDEYEAADAWLGPLCLAMALYGLAIVYLYHFLALGRERVAVVLVLLLAAQTVAYALFHDEPSQLIGVQIAFGVLAVIACETWYHLRR